jgi:hypothetical protein
MSAIGLILSNHIGDMLTLYRYPMARKSPRTSGWRQMMTSGCGGQLVTSAVVNLAHAIEQKMTM